MNRELREFRRLERVCLEQAALSTMDLARSGLLKVADDCRLAAEAIESQPVHRGAIGLAVEALRLVLTVARPPRRH
ncbi:hypothetical protein [Bradyrhizobium guangdongense]|uniref:Uncharacterized protein n=1 Tax=Bradyrhizobium guangdongense TaxID=1325090 RepID=A0ABX6UH25_9BRAD|nr:hypothetical protein [Bradyrhizobium guangdongense]QAU39577.1 hypothetical protein X265_19360 [Bradyrhizobium guangdongense]QOZ60638.1 hypothetical protein XH86_19370 [Bradyrhizobium guangdongense]